MSLVIEHTFLINLPKFCNKSDYLNAVMFSTNNITTCKAITAYNSATHHHFLYHESVFQSGRQVCAFNSISSVSYHLSSAGEEKEVGRAAAHPRQRGEPKEGSILIKGLGAEPWLKIETEGDWHRFLQALTARLTAAPWRWAVEPSRESARLPMMR